MTAGGSRVVVDVPKKLQGKIIGRRGATLADIESDYPGVHVSVPKRNDPSTEVVITGPADAVQHAHARVLDICGMGKKNNDARKHANELYDEANKLFEEAKSVHGDRARRDELWARASAKKKEAHAAQMAAAREIFEQKNAGYGDDQMDLHGLYVSEAVHLVENRLKQVDASLRNGSLPDLTIITGAGHHSVGNKAKIKPAIMELLDKQGYPYTEEGSGGILLVAFGKDAEPTQTRPTQPTAPAQEQPQRGDGGAALFSILSSLASFVFGLVCPRNSGKSSDHDRSERSSPGGESPKQTTTGNGDESNTARSMTKS